MGKNKSVDSKKTSMALNYYYNEAKRKGLIGRILAEGQFKEDAIRTAIARGRISNRMVSAFCIVMGIDSGELVGQKNLSGVIQLINDDSSEIQGGKELNYNEMLKKIQLIVETQKIRPNELRQRVLDEINEVLTRNNW